MSYGDYCNRLFCSCVLSILALTWSEATGDLALLFWCLPPSRLRAASSFFFPQLNYSMRKSRARVCLVLILSYDVVFCTIAGWDKNFTDFKRKGGLQEVYPPSRPSLIFSPIFLMLMSRERNEIRGRIEMGIWVSSRLSTTIKHKAFDYHTEQQKQHSNSR